MIYDESLSEEMQQLLEMCVQFASTTYDAEAYVAQHDDDKGLVAGSPKRTVSAEAPLFPRFSPAQLRLIHTHPMFEGEESLEDLGYAFHDVSHTHNTLHNATHASVCQRLEILLALHTDHMDSSTGCSCPEDDEYDSDQCLEDDAESGPLSPASLHRVKEVAAASASVRMANSRWFPQPTVAERELMRAES